MQEVQRRPFIHFQLHLSDGTVYDVRHPELVIVGLDTAVIGIPAETHPQLAARTEIVNLAHVVRLVPVPNPAGGNGTAS